MHLNALTPLSMLLTPLFSFYSLPIFQLPFNHSTQISSKFPFQLQLIQYHFPFILSEIQIIIDCSYFQSTRVIVLLFSAGALLIPLLGHEFPFINRYYRAQAYLVHRIMLIIIKNIFSLFLLILSPNLSACFQPYFYD